MARWTREVIHGAVFFLRAGPLRTSMGAFLVSVWLLVHDLSSQYLTLDEVVAFLKVSTFGFLLNHVAMNLKRVFHEWRVTRRSDKQPPDSPSDVPLGTGTQHNRISPPQLMADGQADITPLEPSSSQRGLTAAVGQAGPLALEAPSSTYLPIQDDDEPAQHVWALSAVSHEPPPHEKDVARDETRADHPTAPSRLLR